MEILHFYRTHVDVDKTWLKVDFKLQLADAKKGRIKFNKKIKWCFGSFK